VIIGDLIETIEMIDVAGIEKEPAKGDIGFILTIRELHEGLPRYEIYFPWIQKSYWLFDDEFRTLS